MEPYYEDERISLFCGDSLSVLAGPFGQAPFDGAVRLASARLEGHAPASTRGGSGGIQRIARASLAEVVG